MGTIHTTSGAASPRIWLEVNPRVRISSQTVRRVCRDGLKLMDIDLVLQYGERRAEGYHMSDNAISQALQTIPDAGSTRLGEQLRRLRNVVVVEVMDTILAAYRLPEKAVTGDAPLQAEFVLH